MTSTLRVIADSFCSLIYGLSQSSPFDSSH